MEFSGASIHLRRRALLRLRSMLLLLSFFVSISVGQIETCAAKLREFAPQNHKGLYRVGVLAIRGAQAAYAEFDTTFSKYLTEAVRTNYNEPIQFEMKPLNFISLFSDVEASNVDFIYVNPSAYSCIESEYGASSLVSQISRRRVGGNIYDLTEFGGVIFTLADNDNITTVSDLKGKSIAAASISGLGSGQMQFRVLQQAGLSFINDPKQLVFTSNQGKVVNGVLQGEFDVGFVRTDQIERTIDTVTGNLVDNSRLKVIDPIQGLNIDGVPFPFESSTPLYPEWNVAALKHVADNVATAVQRAMLDLSSHAYIGEELVSCLEKCNSQTRLLNDSTTCSAECETAILNGEDCDTTADLALQAVKAKAEGKYAGWRSTLSYMELRNMQEETSFISRNNEKNLMQCIRSSRIYDAIRCPPGHFKKSEQEVMSGCEAEGLTCKEGENPPYQCICSPCVKAFDVDVYPAEHEGYHRSIVTEADSSTIGCAKMTLCGKVEQTKQITYHVVDNKRRENASVEVRIHEGDSTRLVAALDIDEGNFTAANEVKAYQFAVAAKRVGTVILEILIDGEQIPQSPLRLEVHSRNCALEYNDDLRTADEVGECICEAYAVSIAGSCIATVVLLLAFLVPMALIFGVSVYIYVEKKRKQGDSVWSVDVSELRYDDPPEVIGQGTFGMVLLAEYRGTNVAVKRVIPPPKKCDHSKNRTSSIGIARYSLLGKVDHAEEQKSSIANSLPTSHKFEAEVSFLANESGGNVANGSGDWHGNESNRSVNIDGQQSIMSNQLSSMPLASGSTDKEKTSIRNGSKRGIRRNVNLYPQDEYSKLKSDFIFEMRHLSKLRHPCITTVMGAVISAREEPLLIMEYMEYGSLHDLLHNETVSIEGEMLLPILRDIASGMRFLHAAKPQVIHGDLKAQNILVDCKFRAKVADFGLSQKKQVGVTGTLLWMAPELFRGGSTNTAASDVYSFGITLYEMYSRKDPFEGEDLKKLLPLIIDPEVNKRPPVPVVCPQVIANLMSDCLAGLSEQRPTFEEIDLRLKRLDALSVEPVHIQAKKKLDAERNAELLFEVFPKHIAEALRDGRKVEPETRKCVTIFFSDIVGFTTISTKLDPRKVSDMLDRLYHRFDELSQKHDIFKIDVIGDAYMAVANLAKDQDDHVKRIAQFSIDAIKAAKGTLIDVDDTSRGFVKIRVGFHSGPVVADVVGSRHPKYSLFGDAVNTASRMESNSLPERIQCSKRSARLLQRYPEIRVAHRGKIRIKGKGEMDTFWINEDGLCYSKGDFSASSFDEDLAPCSSSKTGLPSLLNINELSLEMDEIRESNSFDGLIP